MKRQGKEEMEWGGGEEKGDEEEEKKGGRGELAPPLFLEAKNVGWKGNNREGFLATGSIVQHPGSTFFGGRQCVPEPSLGVCFTVSVVHCQEPGVSFKLLISASPHSRVGVPSALQVLSFGEEREGLADSC